MRTLLLAATALFPFAAHAATYTVVAPGTPPGAGQFASLGQLASVQSNGPFLKPGDEVDVQAGVYNNDEARFYHIGTPAQPVTFKAVGGPAYITTLNGASNGKGSLVFISSDVVVDGFVFAGAPYGSAENEAGIRTGIDYGATGLDANGQPYPTDITVRNSGFLGKGDGILADDCNNTRVGDFAPPGFTKFVNAPCSFTIDHSYFTGNGNGGGLDHGIYIDHYNQLTVTNSLFLGGLDGHLIKSRAFNTDIENNRIIEGPFAIGNSLIDIPQGGTVTLANNVLEIGPANYNGFFNYNEEAYPPALNNSGAMTVSITGNTFIDDASAASPYTANAIWDDSLDTGRTAPATHIPNGSTVSFTVTGNHFYGPRWTASNLWASGDPKGGGIGAAPNHPTVDGSNTVAATGAPTPDLTPPITLPATTLQTLDVTLNGFCIPANNDGAAPYTCPQGVFWWNGIPLTPAPFTITADETTGAQQHVTYQVPVIPGAYQYMNGQIISSGCCETDTGASLSVPSTSKTITVNFPNYRQKTGTIVDLAYGTFSIGGISIAGYSQFPITVVDADHFTFQGPTTSTSSGTSTQVVWFGQGLDLQWVTASLGGSPQVNIASGLSGGVFGSIPAEFPAQSGTPTPDTTPPVLAAPTALTLVAGTSAPVVLSATDPDNTPAQITYKVTTAPAHGTVEDGGVAASGFTQADIAAGLVTYVETGTAATTDSISFTVSDPAGNSVSGTLPITVTAAPPPSPPVLTVPAPLTVVSGTPAVLALSATDANATAAQLAYAITTAPMHGVVKVAGVAASSFTQAQVNAGSVTYTTTATNEVADSFAFSVTDPAGLSVSGTQAISVVPKIPAAIILAPGVEIIPHADGTWGWK